MIAVNFCSTLSALTILFVVAPTCSGKSTTSIRNSEPLLNECNPPPIPKVAQFIIGYGSLMETASKNRTYPNTGENIPVQVKGFSREWNIKGATVSFSTTYLGVVPIKNSSFNGVYFRLPSTENMTESLVKYDERESFYCRQEVPTEDLQVLSLNSTDSSEDKNSTPKGQYWIYINKPKFTKGPSQEFPIVQSYVDVFISGCLELEEKYNLANFTRNCISSTKGWSSEHWVNDRIYPRRPFVYQPKASKIDLILAHNIPKEFAHIRIEG